MAARHERASIVPRKCITQYVEFVLSLDEKGGGMTLEMVSIPTDSSPLTGLFYSPGDAADGRAALLMHGNGMNFYTGALRFLPPVLVEHGIAALSFNRHGHDTISCPTRIPEGNAYQTTSEGVADNEAACHFLAELGYRTPIVIGHSNGGVLAARHVARHPQAAALVLLSAHCGGDEMPRRASTMGLLAGDRFIEFGAQARELVASGNGATLMTMPGWYYVTTAASFVDTLDNSPVLLDEASKITCPVLFLRGSEEDRDLYPAEAFAEAAGGDTDVKIIEDCDHFYTGHEDEVADVVANWLDSVAR